MGLRTLVKYNNEEKLKEQQSKTNDPEALKNKVLTHILKATLMKNDT